MTSPKTAVPASSTSDGYIPSTFAALRHHNYRLWFAGQVVSLIGTWMQSVAQGWVVYLLTGSKLALGTIAFMGTVPTLFLMLPAGAIVDRVPKRSLLLVTQAIMMVLALILTALAATGTLQVWHLGLLALALGVTQSFDAPTRQAMVAEIVEDRRDLMNAIALNSTMFNLARVVGPAIGGLVLAALGPAWCFGLNALTFLAVLVALWRMRLPSRPVASLRQPIMRQVAAGLSYIRNEPPVRTMITLVGVSSLFGTSYVVLLPAFAADVLRAGEAGLGALNAAVGGGALVGSLTVASFGRFRRKGLLLTVGSLLFPIGVILFSLSRTLPLSMAALAVVGWSVVTQNATINTLIQSMCPDELRGRVMAVFTLMIFGATPFGSLLAGSIGEAFGPTVGVSLGGVVALVYALSVLVMVPSLRRLQR